MRELIRKEVSILSKRSVPGFCDDSRTTASVFIMRTSAEAATHYKAAEQSENWDSDDDGNSSTDAIGWASSFLTIGVSCNNTGGCSRSDIGVIAEWSYVGVVWTTTTEVKADTGHIRSYDRSDISSYRRDVSGRPCVSRSRRSGGCSSGSFTDLGFSITG